MAVFAKPAKLPAASNSASQPVLVAFRRRKTGGETEVSTQSIPATVAAGAKAPALVDCSAATISLIRARTAAPASFAITKLDVWGISAFSVLAQKDMRAFAFEAELSGSEGVLHRNAKRVQTTSSA
jgi:hypothetical protein